MRGWARAEGGGGGLLWHASSPAHRDCIGVIDLL